MRLDRFIEDRLGPFGRGFWREWRSLLASFVFMMSAIAWRYWG